MRKVGSETSRSEGGSLPVMRRSGRSSRTDRERVDAARRQVALALGRDPDQRDSFVQPPTSTTVLAPAASAEASSSAASRGIGVLSIGEAAARLGMNRPQLEALIDRGAVQALPTGFTRMIPTAEVVRLLARS
jgi:excisionase family DNA binding protein